MVEGLGEALVLPATEDGRQLSQFHKEAWGACGCSWQAAAALGQLGAVWLQGCVLHQSIMCLHSSCATTTIVTMRGLFKGMINKQQ